MQAAIRAIEYHLPETTLTNEQLAAEFPEWTPAKIEDKLGVRQRRIAAVTECASDLGVIAAEKLFDAGVIHRRQVDYLVFCTQSPDYFLPTTACVMQNALKLPTTAGAIDINLGCSGFIYGLGFAKGLIESGQARNVLLVTAETYSKFIHPRDKSVRTLFGDAAAATLISGVAEPETNANNWIGPFVYGTDGRGANNLIVPKGGMRIPSKDSPDVATGETSSDSHLYMNGSEIFTFTLQVVPDTVDRLLKLAEYSLDDIDLFVFHQANKYMLEHLRRKLRLPSERFVISMEQSGNTVSATIPIALRDAQASGRLHDGDLVMLVGFGVGYSWAGTLIRWYSPESTGSAV